MDHTLRWGILACGNIANEFAKAALESDRAELVAVSSRDLDKAREFAGRYGEPTAYGDYDDLLADESLDAIYIATLHPFHREWIGKALRAGKHVLCEKPLTMNLRETREAFGVARDCGLILREAFMSRHHPQTRKVVELIEEGTIGEVRMIEAGFCVNAGHQPESRLQAKELGGGAILDLGCYPMSLARLVAGRAVGKPFADPLELEALGHLDPELGTDMWTSALVRFEGDLIAKLSCAMRVQTERKGGAIYGDKGRIIVEEAWHCRDEVRLEIGDESPRIFRADTSRPLFTYEIEAFAREAAGEPLDGSAVGMSEADTLGNMAALDQWREAIGLRYEADEAG